MLHNVVIENSTDLSRVINQVRRRLQNIAGPIFSLSYVQEDKSIVQLDLTKLNRITEHVCEDQVITVESGISIKDLNSYLMKTNQWFPLILSGDKWALGYAISIGDGGLLEHFFGGPRQLVLGLDVTNGVGAAIKCGGKVVKNVTGYDLQKLFIGSQQTLGVITSSNLRLFTFPEKWVTYTARFKTTADAYLAASALMDSGLSLATLEIVSGNRLNRLFDKDHPQGQTQDNDCIVVVSMLGKESIVKTQSHKVQRYLLAAVEIKDYADKDSRTLIERLSSVRAVDEMEIACSANAQLMILTAWRDKILEWQSRPGCGRLKIKLTNLNKPSVTEQEQLVKGLEESVVMAFSGGNMIHAVNHFPYQKKVFYLIEQLKEVFDPDGCLNPFVRL